MSGPSVVSPAQFAGPPIRSAIRISNHAMSNETETTVTSVHLAGRRIARRAGHRNSQSTKLDVTKAVAMRIVTGPQGVGSSGRTALLNPSTTAAIASQKTTWNVQKICQRRQRRGDCRPASKTDSSGDWLGVRWSRGMSIRQINHENHAKSSRWNEL